ncbi:MAG: hypothetical protein VR67_06570 [Peptococcaceae bacterium BRH_c8a]|nr:MAG: hypothetical protein VR67_06570 [Peptococcaceae bacterium BRH_c8a]
MIFEDMSREQLIDALLQKDQVIKKLDHDLKRLELIFNHTKIGIVIGSAEGKTLEYMNPAFAQMHDYTVDELTGKPIKDVFDPNFRAKLPFITEIIHKKGSHSFECLHMRKDGTLFPVLVESIAIYSDDGTVLYRVVNVQDITEQKNLQEQNKLALQKSRDFYQAVLEEFPALLWCSGPDGKCNYFNKGWLQFTGRTIKQELGEGWTEGVHPEDLNKCLKIFHGAIKEHKPFSMEYRLRCDSGDFRWVVDNGTPYTNLDGRFAGYMGVCYDITERKETNKVLSMYQLLSTQARDIVLFIKLDSMIIEANNAALKAYGYTRDELLNKSIYDLRHPDTVQMIKQQMVQAQKQGITFETIYRRKDGSVFPAEVSSKGADINGERVLLSIIRDISKRKRLEDALHRSEILYRTIFEASSTAMAIIEDNGLLSVVNMEFENIFGFTRAETENKLYWKEMIAQEHISEIKIFHRCINLIDSDAAPRGYEFTAINKLGNLINVFATFSLIPGSQRIVASLTDITDRKQSEEALRRATQEKTLILNGISEIVLYYDLDMKILWANRAASIFTGLTQGQLRGRHCYEIFFNSFNVCADCLFINIMSSGKPSNGEIKKIMGRTFFVRGYPVGDQNGVTIGFVFVMTDLTERKQIERALKESESKFRAVYDAVNVGIALVNLGGKIFDINKTFQKMLGYNADELDGMHFKDITHEEDYEQDRQLFNELISGTRKCYQLEKRYRHKNGNIIWVRLNVSVVQDGNGKINNVIGVAEDITQHKLAAEALRISEEKYRLLFHNANDAILLYDIGDYNGSGRFIEVNDVACRVLGYSREKLLTMTPVDINPPCNFNFISNFISIVIQNGFGITETFHVTKTGIKIPVEVNAHLFNLRGANVILAIARDITERKKAEDALSEAKTKANRAERLASLGTLTAGVAHEINQPLNSIKMTADSLLYWHSLNGTLDLNEVVEELNNISNQAERIGSIINRMRVFVRSEHNAQLDYCDLNNAVEGALNMVECQLTAHGVNVKKSLLYPMPPIMADKHKLEEIVINVTINAMQALDTSGKSNKELLISTDYKNNVILEISDNATGVDKSITHKIFEPFFTTKEAGVGMGLGLSIVHSIITSFEGQVYVKENQMGGATFRIEFPVAKPQS